eukprot:4177046-Pyramimonas_sp.AAC.1
MLNQGTAAGVSDSWQSVKTSRKSDCDRAVVADPALECRLATNASTVGTAVLSEPGPWTIRTSMHGGGTYIWMLNSYFAIADPHTSLTPLRVMSCEWAKAVPASPIILGCGGLVVSDQIAVAIKYLALFILAIAAAC